jgi:hypothetical protein
VKCRSRSQGSSGRNRAAAVCCYLLQTILTSSAHPVFLARQASEPCLPLAGSVPISQGALGRAVLMPRFLLSLFNYWSPTKALECVPALGPPGQTKMEPLLPGSMAPIRNYVDGFQAIQRVSQ